MLQPRARARLAKGAKYINKPPLPLPSPFTPHDVLLSLSLDFSMRSLLLTLLLNPLLRTTTTVCARRSTFVVPALEYPVCRRNFTRAAPLKQDFDTIMADISKEQQQEVERLQGPASKEAEILAENEGREEALKDKAKAEEDKKEEEKLPKLSAADFRVYNSMAEHMEYFVRPQFQA
jgi:hypothetical protein